MLQRYCCAAVAVACCLLYPVSAHAYLDAGTGSLILQALIAAVAGAALGIRVYWQKLKTFAGRRSRTGRPSDPLA